MNLRYSTTISVIFSLIFLTVVIFAAADTTKSENIVITELDQGIIQGILHQVGGKPFVEYLQIPLKLSDNGTSVRKNDSVLIDQFVNNTSELKTKLLNCTYNITEVNKGHPDCIFLNVYTTKLNQSDPNDKMPVEFCVWQEKEKCPPFNFDSRKILIISEDRLQQNVSEKEDLLTNLIHEWLNKNIEKFGGDGKNIKEVSVLSSDEETQEILKPVMPMVIQEPFVVGYELSDSANIKPIYSSESLKISVQEDKESRLEQTTIIIPDDATTVPSTRHKYPR